MLPASHKNYVTPSDIITRFERNLLHFLFAKLVCFVLSGFLCHSCPQVVQRYDKILQKLLQQLVNKDYKHTSLYERPRETPKRFADWRIYKTSHVVDNPDASKQLLTRGA